MSERLTFAVIKIIMPCVEGDRSDCQPSTTTIALSRIELASGRQSDLSPSTHGIMLIVSTLLVAPVELDSG